MQAAYQAGTNVIRKGMINSFVSMFKEEGLRGLYRVICFKSTLIINEMCSVISVGDTVKLGKWNNNNIINNSYIILTKYGQAFLLCFLVVFFVVVVVFLLSVVLPT